MMAIKTEFRIYVGTYHKYNNGSIEGNWIDLSEHDQESFNNAIKELHKDESDPEYMFQDHEGIPEMFISESGLEANFWEFKEYIDNNEHNEGGLIAFTEHFNEFNTDRFEECYHGEYESELDYTYQYIDDTGMLQEMDESLQRYFDYESFARDLFMDYTFIDGHVFSSY